MQHETVFFEKYKLRAVETRPLQYFYSFDDLICLIGFPLPTSLLQKYAREHGFFFYENVQYLHSHKVRDALAWMFHHGPGCIEKSRIARILAWFYTIDVSETFTHGRKLVAAMRKDLREELISVLRRDLLKTLALPPRRHVPVGSGFALEARPSEDSQEEGILCEDPIHNMLRSHGYTESQAYAMSLELLSQTDARLS